MFTTSKKYHLGKKVFWYFFLFKNKVLLSVFLLLLATAYIFLIGSFTSKTVNFLLENISYVELSLVKLWAAMILISYIFVVLLRTSVLYKQYSFTLHKHALHVHHGIFFIKEHVMPYAQIVNVEIKRSLGLFVFGLVEVDIITGLTEQEMGTNKKGLRVSLLPVIDKNLAKELSHKLMALAAEHNGYKQPQTNTKVSRSETKRKRR